MNNQRYIRRPEFDRRRCLGRYHTHGGSWGSLFIVYTAVGYDPNQGKGAHENKK